MNIKNIKFINFTLIRDNKNLLEDLDFTISNDKYILVGKNGIGKSSLLDCLYKINKKYSGEIYIDDINLKKINNKDLRQKYMSYINQELMLIHNITILENIKLFQKDDKVSDEIIKEVEKTLNLDINCTVNNLSGGEKQYINILLNIMNDKPILLIDEPFNNLSFNKIKKIIHLIEKENKFIICVSHKKIDFKKLEFNKRKLTYE